MKKEIPLLIKKLFLKMFIKNYQVKNFFFHYKLINSSD